MQHGLLQPEPQALPEIQALGLEVLDLAVPDVELLEDVVPYVEPLEDAGPNDEFLVGGVPDVAPFDDAQPEDEVSDEMDEAEFEEWRNCSFQQEEEIDGDYDLAAAQHEFGDHSYMIID